MLFRAGVIGSTGPPPGAGDISTESLLLVLLKRTAVAAATADREGGDWALVAAGLWCSAPRRGTTGGGGSCGITEGWG